MYLGRLCEPATCDSEPCQNGAVCVPRLYEYQCDCLVGYTGNLSVMYTINIKTIIIELYAYKLIQASSLITMT